MARIRGRDLEARAGAASEVGWFIVEKAGVLDFGEDVGETVLVYPLEYAGEEGPYLVAWVKGIQR